MLAVSEKRLPRTDEIPVLEVETVKLVASRLCVHYVFIDDEGCALGVVGDALADLAGDRLAWRARQKA